MIIRDKKTLADMQHACTLATEVLRGVYEAVAVGVTPLELDALADELCAERGTVPNFKGVGPIHNLYKHAMCISVNDTILHGIPDAKPLVSGDMVKLDFGLEWQGFHTDHCTTVIVGGPRNAADLRLVETTRKAVLAGVSQAVAGNRTGAIGSEIEQTALAAGFDVVREFIGHGIGRSLHEEPEVPAWGKPSSGTVLKEGMVICVEAQIINGSARLYTSTDGWSLKTSDGSRGAMSEFMVLVGKREATILTPTQEWEVVR